MKEYRVKPSKAAVTTISVASRQHHYFHSEVLGGCRAVLISDDENLPLPAEPPKAKKPKPTKCWDCGCKTIRVMTVGKHPPAYICGLCDLWLGDVEKYDG